MLGAGALHIDVRVWYERTLTHATGPAHAAHFVTLETVKQALGGNADAKHHPFVAGILRISYISRSC